MQVETKEIEDCKLHIIYEADPDAVEAKRDEAIAELRKVAIPGFRPGKAPDYAIKAQCKDKINNWVAHEMASQAYDDVLFETKIKPIGQPKIENVSLKNNTFSCEMTVMKKPDFELGDYKSYEIPKPHFDRDVTAQTERALQDIRLRFGDIEPYDDGDFVETGDQITMDFIATIDGESFDGSTADGMLYTVGENQFPEFDDNILGMSPGEEREFDLTFPEHLDKVGGKTAQFKVQVHMGTKRKPAPLNDELAKKVGMESIKDVQEKIRSIAETKINQTEKQMVGQQVANRLVEDHDFEVPVWLVDMEAQHSAAQQQIDWNQLNDEQKQPFKEQAKQSVKLSLILDSIRENEPEAVLSDAEAINALKQQVASQGVDPEKFVVEKQKNGVLFGLVAALRDQFTLQFLADKAKLVE